MAFDVEKFNTVVYEPRTAEVSAKDLQGFFGEDEPAIFIVRNLTASEFSMLREEVDKERAAKALLQNLGSSVDVEEKVQAALTLIGSDPKERLPPEYVRYIAAVRLGVVEPKLPQQAVVKIATTHPVLFESLAMKIFQLSGLGAVEKK